MFVMMYGSVVYATWPKIAGVMDVINITFVRIRSPVKTEFILGQILRPCLHITFCNSMPLVRRGLTISFVKCS